MNDMETAFLAAIEASPDDEAPHGVFADWLDEHDRPEEADWHRAWTAGAARAAREWFVNFAAGHYHDPNYYREDDIENHEYHLTAEQAIEAGRVWLATIDPKFNQGKFFTQMGSESLRDMMRFRERREEYWRNWALATGTYVPPETAKDGHVFSCSC